MADTKKNTSLSVMDDFRIVNRYEGMDPELMEQIQDEMEDLDAESGIICRQIKVPSGGGSAFEVQGEDEDDTEPRKQIDAVIVFTHRVNAYWPAPYGKGDDSDKIPVCSSIDGKTGFNPSTGEVTPCESCPYNQYGTGVDENGNSQKGKACKNMRRIYMIMDGDPNFYLLTVPPTSIKDINKQLARILASGVPYTGTVVSFTLEKVKNSGGIAYSKVQVKKSGFLPKATAEAIKALHRELKAQYKNTAVTSEDYTAPANTSLDINPDDDDLPFN